MILGIDPKVDYAFKYLLGRESTRVLLIDVLNKVLKLPAGQWIEDIELLNPFNLQETPDDKLSILDIKARDQASRQFNIEMQMLGVPHYDKRILYYWSKFHQQQLHDGNDYATLRPTISISFLNHVLFPQVPDYHLKFHLLESTHHFAMTGDIEFRILELPKFVKTLAELESGLDLWLYFLRFAEKIDTEALPMALREPGIVRAVEELKMLTQTDIERERYEARLKAQFDQNTLEAHARRERDMARKIGQEEGREQGREEGQKIGKEIGQKIGQEVGQKVGTIHAYERLLQRSITPKEQLLARSLEDLTRLAEDLEKQVMKPR